MSGFRLNGEPETVRVDVRIVQRADAEFPFLHDTMVVPLAGRLLLAWYHCSEDEIQGRTVIRGRWSSDGGESWSEPELIAEDPSGRLHMVPVTFSEYGGEIWAYVTEMTGHDRPTGYRCVRYHGGAWETVCRRDDLVLFNTLPQTLGNGEWIVGGRAAYAPGAHPEIPVVAVSRPQSPADWRVVRLPGPWDRGTFPLRYPETALWADGNRISAFVRNDAGPAQVYESEDFGRTWSGPTDCGFPIAPAKLCAGSLPDGRRYLIFNARTDANDRSHLVMAIRRRGADGFERVLTLVRGEDRSINAGPYWHYPCACVFGDTLYVSCTSSGEGVARHAALLRVPLDEL